MHIMINKAPTMTPSLHDSRTNDSGLASSRQSPKVSLLRRARTWSELSDGRIAIDGGYFWAQERYNLLQGDEEQVTAKRTHYQSDVAVLPT